MSELTDKIIKAIGGQDHESVRTVEMLRDDLNLLIDRGQGDLLVVLQKDAEGNGYSPLRMIDPAHYEPRSTWEGEVVDDVSEADDDTVPCLVLVPIN